MPVTPRSSLLLLVLGLVLALVLAVMLAGIVGGVWYAAGCYSACDLGQTTLSATPREQLAGWPVRAVAQTAAGALLGLALATTAAVWRSRRIAAVAQRERSELQGQLADAIARTRLAEQKALQSQRVEALGRLTGGVAHDFNNLLGVISNSAHLIQCHPAAKELAAPLSATLRAVDTGSQLTRHLQGFAGRRPTHPQPLQLAHWLPELRDLLRSMLGRRIEVIVHVASGLAAVLVDPNELELALVNLTLNARDAMVDGGTVRVTARAADAEESAGLTGALARGFVQIAITDNGGGIDPELLPKVFEPFFTREESGAATGQGQGQGLDLSQVHGFCVQSGGTARIDSTPGLGTTVMLLLPFA